MNEANSESSPNPSVPTPPAKKRNKLKIILIGLGGIFVLLILLVLLAPTIASMGFVRSMVVGKINDSLNGKVQITDWSLGWTGGIKVQGVKVFDDAGSQILELKEASTELPLLKAIRGNLQLGKVKVDGLDFNLAVDKNGKSNLDNLVKATKESAGPAQPSSTSGGDGKLPDVSADIEIANCRGTITQEQPDGNKIALIVQSIDGKIKIPNINQPIENSLQISSRVGNGPVGTISLAGTASAIKENKIDASNALVDQKLEIKSIDTSGFKTFVPPAVGLDQLAGMINGTVAIKLNGTKGGDLNANIICDGLNVGGKILKGDVYKSDRVTILAPIAIAIPEGSKDFNAARLTTTKENPIQVKTGETTVVASLDVTPGAIQNVINQLPPGSAGTLDVSVDVDAGQLAKQLPNTLSIPKDLTLTSGKLKQTTSVVLAADKATIKETIDLNDVAGTSGGKNVALKPIQIALNATTLGKKGNLPDLRDIGLTLTSAFATANFNGQSIAQLTGKANGDLAKLQAEIGQVNDFIRNLTMSGTFETDLANTGDLTSETGSAQFKATTTFRDVKIMGLPDQIQPLQQPLLQIVASGNLQRGGDKFLKAVNDILLTVQSGNPQSPTVDVAASANVNIGEAIDATFKLSKAKIDLAKAQTEFVPLVKPLRESGFLMAGGSVNASAEGSYKGTVATLSALKVNAENVTLKQQPKDEPVREVLTNYSLNVDAAATVNTAASIACNVSKLSITDSAKLLNVQKINDGDLLVHVGDKGAFYGNGKLQIASDLGSLNGILKKFGKQTTVQSQNAAGEIKSGMFAGTIELAHAATQTNVVGDFKISNLIVSAANGPTPQQQLSIALKASVPEDISSVTAEKISVTSDLVTADVSDTTIKLPKAGDAQSSPLNMVQKANVNVAVKDLPGLYSLAMAFMPPAVEAPKSANDKSATPPLPPLQITGGTLNFVATVVPKGDSIQIDVSQLAGNGIAIKRGDGAYSAEPFSVTLKANVAGVSGGDTLTASVDQLEGKLGIADLAMTQPFKFSKSKDSLNVTGTIQLTGGNVERVCQLLEAINGKKAGTQYPYQGQLKLVQVLTTSGDTVGVKGNVDIAGFKVLQDGKPIFSEDQVAVTNEISADMKAHNLDITKVSAVMQSSQAVNLNATGKIGDWENARTINGLVIDLGYDLAKIWPIVKPMIPPESQETVKDLVVEGKFQKQFTVSGSYPANVSQGEAISKLKADGDFEIAMLQVKGLDIRNFVVPISLRGGYALVVYGNKPGGGANLPKPADCNSGKLDISNTVVDLRGDTPLLTMTANQKILQGVQLNSVLAQSLGKSAVLLFADASDARGVVDVTVLQCEKVPVADLIHQKATMKFAMSVTNLEIDGPIPKALTSIPQLKRLRGANGGLAGSINNAQFEVGNGQVVSDIPLMLGDLKDPLKFTGGIGLEKFDLRNFFAMVPANWFDEKLAKYLPSGIPLSFSGTTSAYNMSMGSIDKIIGEAAVKAAADEGLGKLLGGKKNDQQQPQGGQPNQPKNGDAKSGDQKKEPTLEDALGGLLKKKDKPKDQPKKN